MDPLYLLFVIRDLNSSENSRVDNIETPTLTYIIRGKHDSGLEKTTAALGPMTGCIAERKLPVFGG